MAELERMPLGRDPVVASLLSASANALRAGQHEKASKLLRQAADMAPYDESVWWALLETVDNEADRVVCLENILAINPTNAEARRLHRLANIGVDIANLTPAIPAQSFTPLPAKVRPLPPRASKGKPKQRRILRFIAIAIFFTILAVLLAVVLSILVYGF